MEPTELDYFFRPLNGNYERKTSPYAAEYTRRKVFGAYLKHYRGRCQYLKELVYILNCWILPWRRYNVVRVRSLPPTWCDRSHILPMVMMQVLTDFVERELYVCGSTRPEEDELKSHYVWFHENYLKADPWVGYKEAVVACPKGSKCGWEPDEAGMLLVEACETHTRAMNEVTEKEKALEDELNKRCLRVFELREFMWT